MRFGNAKVKNFVFCFALRSTFSNFASNNQIHYLHTFMITFIKKDFQIIYVVSSTALLSQADLDKLEWLFEAKVLKRSTLSGTYVGPRREMVTPWSTNAVEITQNMGIDGIGRIERFKRCDTRKPAFDPMLQSVYHTLDDSVFDLDAQPQPIVHIDDIQQYNLQQGLALSQEEVEYLQALSQRLGRRLTDSEVFGFSQVNSEHCRHKIFNGTFIIDGKAMPDSLFQLIKNTSRTNPGHLVSAYSDNVAFIDGPMIAQFAPQRSDAPSEFAVRDVETVLSLKAETHNFPTTVEPFNGAATGTGGEIRDRLGGGRASLPLAGTAVYMTAYPRTQVDRRWELCTMPPRRWLYHDPADILIKASNGASDFGNKFGQPLICGSVLTFENKDGHETTAYDKVVMLAGGVGYAARRDAIKAEPAQGDELVVMGGDNYRIGMGGGAVSSVNTGQLSNSIELNAVQRSNPEMQKRVANVIRALAEQEQNPIVSIHDHGAGGHLNALSELVENTGGSISMGALPIGDPTLSAREIIGNESQERMGLVVNKSDTDHVVRIAQRERAPIYVVGHATGDRHLTFEQTDGQRPIDLDLADMFGNPPKTIISDNTVVAPHRDLRFDVAKLDEYLETVLQMEAVACKDWLTNKVDRSVTGRVAHQQCQGELQLPLADCGVVALDYSGTSGMATSIGHAPQAALIDSAMGSQLAIVEALTNIIGANLSEGLKSVSLSANWMWPCRNPGQDARLYRAVKACSDLACQLGINIPTGKDSLSMTQDYGKKRVLAPGTVIITAAAPVADVKKTVGPVLRNCKSHLYYIDFSDGDLQLGGSAFAQSMGRIGMQAPTLRPANDIAAAFNAVQDLVAQQLLLAVHDVSAGGLITTLLEMTFANTRGGLDIDLSAFSDVHIVRVLFAENPAIVIQVADAHCRRVERLLAANGVRFLHLGQPAQQRTIELHHRHICHTLPIDKLRDIWFRSSYLLDCLQSGSTCAKQRFSNYGRLPLRWRLPNGFTGQLSDLGLCCRHGTTGIKAAIVRDKGVNGDREMAYSLYLAGFDVKDVHMTDLMSGRETLDDVNMIAFCGGFSNSDVPRSARGWAGAFVWNEQAHVALKRFYARPDTLSLGVCNGCQLMMELGLLAPHSKEHPSMTNNDSHKFESQFLAVTIPNNTSVMLGNLAGARLGIWVAHGEGKFVMPTQNHGWQVAAQYASDRYPGNPNGSPDAIAALASADGRHLAIMPHLERSIFPWQCAYYPRRSGEVTPWIKAFVNAREWVERHVQVTK
ncbi:MAG: phosphoribosylformylglycinamidine synthase [Muribaculaceae bacterium]|nr:phosphoribosylformylglycinamidine synthase [Muribaculaceae bacterium]